MSRKLNDNGFTLMEVIPAVSLLGTVSMLALKLLGIGMQLQQRVAREDFIRTSHALVCSSGRLGMDSVMMCRARPDGGWELLSFPDESWLPDQSGGNDWILWRRHLIEEMPHRIVATEYTMADSGDWKWWNSTIVVSQNENN